MAPKACAFCKAEASDTLKLKLCTGCGEVGYCSKEHQSKDWKDHKKVCKKQHIKPTENAHLRKDDKDVPVLWEDQQRINQFGRLNSRLQDLLDELETKKSMLEGLKDASAEIDLLLDDDACKVRVGDLYVNVPNDDAVQYIADQKVLRTQEMEALVKEQEGIQEEMAKLKTVLYLKFGNTINLETK